MLALGWLRRSLEFPYGGNSNCKLNDGDLEIQGK